MTPLDEITSLLEPASPDERAAFAVIARKVMGAGRVTYGPTDLAVDRRDFRREAADEITDAVWYWALAEVRKQMVNRRASSIELVREFHTTYGQAIADMPIVNDAKLNDLRVSLLDEELDELAVALQHRDPVATLDALTDLQYVLDGAYLALGFHRFKDAALAEVHRSNMSKLGEDGKPVLREDGKILKGPAYSPPDLRAVMAKRYRVAAFAAANDNDGGGE